MNDYDLIIKCRKYVMDTIKSITKLEINPLSTLIEEQLIDDIKHNIDRIKIIRNSMFILRFIRFNNTNYDKIIKYINDKTLLETYIKLVTNNNCIKLFLELSNEEKYGVALEIYNDYTEFLQKYVILLFPIMAYISNQEYDKIMGDGHYGINKQLIYILKNYNPCKNVTAVPQ